MPYKDPIKRKLWRERNKAKIQEYQKNYRLGLIPVRSNSKEYIKICEGCNKSFITKNTLSKYCKPQHSPNHRERKRLAKRKGPRWPKWQCKKQIAEFYRACPPGYEVDHIIPLNHPNVTGLNVIDNLQYLEKSENQLKSNLWDGTLDNRGWRKLLR